MASKVVLFSFAYQRQFCQKKAYFCSIKPIQHYNMLQDKIKQLAKQLYPTIAQAQQWLHQHPETAFQEQKTAAYIADFLQENGIAFNSGIAKTGIVGHIYGKPAEGKTLALRADMDALEIEEQSAVPYTSLHPGKMHACGHDLHMASLLGSILILNALKDEYSGCIKFIFQPSEEKNPGGASVMIAEGALEQPQAQQMIAQHVLPELETGKVGFCKGAYMASTDELYLTITAKGGHGGIPQQTFDTVLIASHIVVALQQMVSRRANPFMPTVLSFGRFIANGQTNVIPPKVEIAGTMRTFDEHWRQQLQEEIAHTAKGIAQAMGGNCELRVSPGFPAISNNEPLTNNMISAAQAFLGDDKVVNIPPRTTGDDFGFYAERMPVCYYRLGVGKAQAHNSGLHTAQFVAQQESLLTGMGLMAWLSIEALRHM